MTSDVKGLAHELAGGGPVELPDASLGYREALLVADPDGHVMRVQGGAQ